MPSSGKPEIKLRRVEQRKRVGSETGDLRFGLGFWLGGMGSDRADVHADDGESGTADAVGRENAEGQRCEAGTS